MLGFHKFDKIQNIVLAINKIKKYKKGTINGSIKTVLNLKKIISEIISVFHK